MKTRLSLFTRLLLGLAFVLLLGGTHWIWRTAKTQAQTAPPAGYPAECHGGVTVTAEDVRAMAAPSDAQVAALQAAMERKLQKMAKRPLASNQVDAVAALAETSTASIAEPTQIAPTPVTGFRANLFATQQEQESAMLAADTSVAVSSTHVVVGTRDVFVFLTKSGRRLQAINTSVFFAPLNLDHDDTIPVYQKAKQKGLPIARVASYYDARVIYDEYRQRFWLIALAFNQRTDLNSTLSKYVVAVSRTQNPLDGFYQYWWDAVPGDGTDYVGESQLGNRKQAQSDYDTIGVDQFGIYTNNTCARGSLPRYYNVTFFAAAPLANGTLGNGWTFGDSLRYPNNGQASFIIQPAVHHGASNTTYFVSAWEHNRIVLWKLTNHLQANMQMRSFEVPINALTTVIEGEQKNNTAFSNPSKISYSNVNNDVLKAVYRNNTVWAVMQDGARVGGTITRTDSRVVRIPNVNGAGPTFPPAVDRHFNDPDLTVHNGFPSIEVNRDNDAAISTAFTGPTFFPGLQARTLDGSSTLVSERRILKEGETTMMAFDLNSTPLPAVLLHDTTGASVDPFDDTAIWLAGAFSKPRAGSAATIFDIWVAKIYGAAHPDLVVEEVRPLFKTFKPGGNYSVRACIGNQGDGAAPAAPVNFYLSTNRSLSVLDTRVGQVNSLALAAGASQCQDDFSVTIPANLNEGIYYLGATVGAVTGEYSSNNNQSVFGSLVVVRKEDAEYFGPSPGALWHTSFAFGDEVPQAGDFNGDGKDDIVAFNKTDGAVYVALSDGTKFNGTGAAARWGTGFVFGRQTPVVGDFDGDGRADVAVFIHDTKTGTEAGEVYVALSRGNGFTASQKWSDGLSFDSADAVSAGDYNGDGKDDLLVVERGANKTGDALVALSDGSRFGAAALWYDNLVTVRGSAQPLATGDYNEDGKDDIAVFQSATGDVRVGLSGGLNFSPLGRWHDNYLLGGPTTKPAAGDFDGDGRSDIVAFTAGTTGDVFVAPSALNPNRFTDKFERWHNHFALGAELPVIGDFNGDGADDIATFLRGGTGDVYVSLARTPIEAVMTSAATYSRDAIAANSIATVFGQNMATQVQLAATVPLPTELGGTTVTLIDAFNRPFAAPLLFVSPSQINFVVPNVQGVVSVLIRGANGAFSSDKTVNLLRHAPGLFSANAEGTGLPAAVLLRLRANGALDYEAIYRFENGAVIPLPIDFSAATDQLALIAYGTGIRGYTPNAPLSVTIGGISASFVQAGAAPGFAGLDQVNIGLPRTLAGRGLVNFTLTVEGKAANQLQLQFK